jgi:uncharacterized protein (DUF58 family)
VAVSGWFVLLVALGILPVVVLGDPGWLPAWLLLVAVVGAIDLVLAGSPRRLMLERELPQRVRLGETVPSILYLTGAAGRAIR